MTAGRLLGFADGGRVRLPGGPTSRAPVATATTAKYPSMIRSRAAVVAVGVGVSSALFDDVGAGDASGR